MKEELKLINIGNDKFILCLNDYVLDNKQKDRMDEIILQKTS